MKRLACRPRAVALLALALGGAAASAAAQGGPAQAVQGLVVAVTDGDTLRLRMPERKPVTVRLRDIDAPEICQPWGPEARAALAALALNQQAILTPVARDSYGRVVGRVTVGGIDLGTRLVEDGHAWSTRSRQDRGPLLQQERKARALGRGLHRQPPGAVPPWDWRRHQGPCPRP
ncbi:MAG: thermonuclease family protein [Ideonella sp. WA131b]|nr:thermonuclease family protein [Ideonella sp. WA131b]